MPKYKNIRIKKKGGGTRTQRVRVLASGKYRFVKNPSRSSKIRGKVKKIYRRGRKIARRRKRRRSNTFKIPLAPTLG